MTTSQDLSSYADSVKAASVLVSTLETDLATAKADLLTLQAAFDTYKTGHPDPIPVPIPTLAPLVLNVKVSTQVTGQRIDFSTTGPVDKYGHTTWMSGPQDPSQRDFGLTFLPENTDIHVLVSWVGGFPPVDLVVRTGAAPVVVPVPVPVPVPTPVPPSPLPQSVPPGSSTKPSSSRIQRPNASGRTIPGTTTPIVLGPGDSLRDVTINGDQTIVWSGGKANRVLINGNGTYRGMPHEDTTDIFCNGQGQLLPSIGSAPFEASLIRWGGRFGSSDGFQFVRPYNPADSTKSYTGHATLNMDDCDFRQDGSNYIEYSPGNFPHGDCIQLLGLNVVTISNTVCDLFKAPDFTYDPVSKTWIVANPESQGRTSAIRFESYGEGGEFEKVETHGLWLNGGGSAISGKMFDLSAMPLVMTHYDTHFGPETMGKRTFLAYVGGFPVGTLVRPTDEAGKAI